MASLSPSRERFDEITSALEEKGVKSPCPRCGHNSFSILEGHTFVALLDKDGKEHQRIFPMISVTCNNCGCRFEHSAVVLGLEEPHEEVEEDEGIEERESYNAKS